MIAMRQVDSPFRQIHGNTPQRPTSPVKDTFRLQEWTATVDTLVGQSERELKRAAANQELLHADLKELITELKEVTVDKQGLRRNSLLTRILGIVRTCSSPCRTTKFQKAMRVGKKSAGRFDGRE